ncbi:hypothetical protein GC163_07810 [bacterium]|nr:hypothetical protein [bacterium]
MIPDRSEELSLALADWGVTITHLAVTAAFDAETQTVSETTATTELLAILGPLESKVHASLPGQQQRQQRSLLVRSTDWPEIDAGVTRRVIIEDVSYDIIEILVSEAAGWLRVTGVRRD